MATSLDTSTKRQPSKVETSVGLETSDQTLSRAKSLLSPSSETPAPGSVASIASGRTPFTYAQTADDKAADEARQRLLAINGADANLNVDPEKEYRAKLKQYQAQIDATNAVYNDRLNASRLAGQGRLGSSRASQGRSGLLGSDFGAAQTDTVTNANLEADAAVQDERNVAINAILGLARKDALDAVTAKTTAKKAGADALLKYYTEDVPAQKTARLNKIAKALAEKNLDPKDLTPEELKQITTNWNVSADDVSSAFGEYMSTTEAAAKKADLETKKAQADIDKINADIAAGKLITLGEGSTLYNVETGETIKNPKTYAPTDGNGQDRMLTITEALNLGVPFGSYLSDVVGQGIVPTGKTTGEQQTNFGFYQRAKQASDNIVNLEDGISKMTLGQQAQLQYAPNVMQTQDQQKYRQAQRQFTEARLRADSGAAVPDAEYQQDAMTFFAQPGDTPETLAQKRAARQQVLDAMSVQSGPAYRDFYGQMPIQQLKSQQSTAPASAQPQQMRLGNGTIVTLQADGTYQ